MTEPVKSSDRRIAALKQAAADESQAELDLDKQADKARTAAKADTKASDGPPESKARTGPPEDK